MLSLLVWMFVFAGVLAIISIFMRYGKTGLLPPEAVEEIRQVITDATDG